MKFFERLIFYFLFALAIASCAHKLAPVAMPENANPAQEIEKTKTLRQQSLGKQANVLAPKSFLMAEKYLKEGQEDYAKGVEDSKIIKSLAMANAYYANSDINAAKASEPLREVINSRQSALHALAGQDSKPLNQADGRLFSYAEKMEDGKVIPPQDVSDLQQKFLNVELNAIKATKLGKTKEMLAIAEKKNAKTILPRTFALAQQKFNAAEKLIETERDNTDAINIASNQARVLSERVLTLLDKSNSSKNQTPEQNALAMEAQDNAVLEADSATALAESNTERSDSLLNEKTASLNTAQDQIHGLKSRDELNQVLESARKQFSASEADVYRQGDKLIIRLKSIEFASGRSELPSQSMPALNKVKTVIADLGSESIVIEGHTDSLGAAEKNKALSLKRAEAVSEFFVASKAIESDMIKSVGYGFEKPLSTNKTKVGRAQNRRVDIVITPMTETTL